MLDLASQGSRSARDRLGLLLRAANDAFFEVDLGARRIAWTRGVQLLFGHDPDRVGPRLEDWQALVHPEDLGALVESGRTVVREGGTSWSDEFRFARADGSFATVRARAFVVREDERPTHVIGSLADLSPLRQIEDELNAATAELTAEVARERHERIRAELLMRSATSEALAEWTIATGEIRWSPNVRDVLGYGPDELPTIDHIAARIHPDDVDGSLGALRRIVEGTGSGWSGQLRFQTRDGRFGPVESHVNVLRDDEGRALTCIGSVRRLPEAATDAETEPPALTERQRDVLRLVRLGHSNKEIAARLGIGEQAAKVQVSKLLRKFRAQNRAGLVAAAGRLGL